MVGAPGRRLARPAARTIGAATPLAIPVQPAIPQQKLARLTHQRQRVLLEIGIYGGQERAVDGDLNDPAEDAEQYGDDEDVPGHQTGAHRAWIERGPEPLDHPPPSSGG